MADQSHLSLLQLTQDKTGRLTVLVDGALGNKLWFHWRGAGRVNVPVVLSRSQFRIFHLFPSVFLYLLMLRSQCPEDLDQLVGSRWSSIPAVAQADLEWGSCGGLCTRTETISGSQGLASHCVFSLLISQQRL